MASILDSQPDWRTTTNSQFLKQRPRERAHAIDKGDPLLEDWNDEFFHHLRHQLALDQVQATSINPCRWGTAEKSTQNPVCLYIGVRELPAPQPGLGQDPLAEKLSDVFSRMLGSYSGHQSLWHRYDPAQTSDITFAIMTRFVEDDVKYCGELQTEIVGKDGQKATSEAHALKMGDLVDIKFPGTNNDVQTGTVCLIVDVTLDGTRKRCGLTAGHVAWGFQIDDPDELSRPEKDETILYFPAGETLNRKIQKREDMIKSRQDRPIVQEREEQFRRVERVSEKAQDEIHSYRSLLNAESSRANGRVIWSPSPDDRLPHAEPYNELKMVLDWSLFEINAPHGFDQINEVGVIHVKQFDEVLLPIYSLRSEEAINLRQTFYDLGKTTEDLYPLAGVRVTKTDGWTGPRDGVISGIKCWHSWEGDHEYGVVEWAVCPASSTVAPYTVEGDSGALIYSGTEAIGMIHSGSSSFSYFTPLSRVFQHIEERLGVQIDIA